MMCVVLTNDLVLNEDFVELNLDKCTHAHARRAWLVQCWVILTPTGTCKLSSWSNSMSGTGFGVRGRELVQEKEGVLMGKFFPNINGRVLRLVHSGI